MIRAAAQICTMLFGLTLIPAQAEGIPLRKAYSMQASSMLPTLRAGEVFWADPVAYRDRAPERGDVIVFRGPGDAIYVMRVIAVGGDTISSEAGILTLNRKPAVLAELPMTLPDPPRNARLWAEGIPGGGTRTILDLRDNAQGDTFAPVTVPEGHLFVMGDNRDNSNDSRFGVGMVSHDRLMGKALTILFSSDFTRIGTGIE